MVDSEPEPRGRGAAANDGALGLALEPGRGVEEGGSHAGAVGGLLTKVFHTDTLLSGCIYVDMYV